MRHRIGVKLACLAAVLAGALAGCGGGGGGSTAASGAPENGQVVIGLTDADGDFLRYEVAVQGIRLTRVDGVVVDALPRSTPVDFAQLTQLAEFVSAATVPAGNYTQASLLLDYSGAVVQVEVGGAAVEVTPALPGGNPLVETAVHFPGDTPLQVRPGRLAHLALDFDLVQSNAVVVDKDAGTATVTVQPFLVADVSFAPTRQHRLRGTLQAVNQTANSFTVALRPFRTSIGMGGSGGHGGPGRPAGAGNGGGVMGPGSGGFMGSGGAPGGGHVGPAAGTAQPGMGGGGRMGSRSGLPTAGAAGRISAGFAGGEFGEVTVLTNSETAFEIDGVASLGDEGLAALAGEPVDTPLVALVTLDPATRSYVALQVYAGSSAPGVNLDVLNGTVVARDANTLTLRRGMMERTNGSFHAGMDAIVVVAESTKVLQEGEGRETDRTIAEISVGQKIAAFGTLSGVPGAYTLDASQGLVRLLVTEVAGAVTTIGTGELTLDAQRLGGSPVERLDFAGTGSDPSAYRVSLGTLPVAGLAAGAPVVARGFVAPFGAAPPDFLALSVAQVSEAPARLRASWNPPSADALEVGASGLLVQPSVSAPAEVVRRGIVLAVEVPIEVVPADTAVYRLRAGGTWALYTDYAAFRDALQVRLAGGAAVSSLSAAGTYADSEARLTATLIAVTLP